MTERRSAAAGPSLGVTAAVATALATRPTIDPGSRDRAAASVEPEPNPVDTRATAVLPVLAAEAQQIDETAAFPERGLAALRGSGLLGLLVPAEHGGLGGDLSDLARVADVLAAECLSTAMIWAMHCQQVAAVVNHGRPELRADLLPRLARGQVYIASVTSERGKGGHLLTADAPLQDQPGDPPLLRLHREAPIVTGGRYADGFLITMRDAPDARPDAVTLVYADRSALKLDTAGSWNPMGMRGTESLPMTLDGSVPVQQVVGARGGFRDVAVRSFVPAGHIAWAACWLGAARHALHEVLELLRSPAGRGQFDLSSTLLRVRLARMRQALDVATVYLGRTIADAEAVRHGAADPDATPFQMRLNGLKVQAGETAFSVVDGLIEIVGMRHGYLRGGPMSLERLFRDLRSASLNYSNDRLLLANGSLTLLDREVSVG